MEKPVFCPMVWLSGFFAMGALVQLGRSIVGYTLTIGGVEVPLAVSMVLAVFFGALSGGFLFCGLKKPCARQPGVDNQGC